MVMVNANLTKDTISMNPIAADIGSFWMSNCLAAREKKKLNASCETCPGMSFKGTVGALKMANHIEKNMEHEMGAGLICSFVGLIRIK